MVENTRRPRKKTGETAADLLVRIADLERRIARLEATRDGVAGLAAPAPSVATPPAPPLAVGAPSAAEPPRGAEVPEAVLLVISAAVAAFFGERAHVRQVRLVSSEAWAQQGRVSVMASHRWAVQR
jgi:methylmalonyl-CoA carboxyltransferase large subunit